MTRAALCLLCVASAARADSSVFDRLESANPQVRDAAWGLLEGALNHGPPAPESLAPHAATIRRIWSRLSTAIGDGRRTAATAVCGHGDEALQSLRGQAELMLDVLGSLDGARADLEQAAQLADPRLAFYALRSLARQHFPLDPVVIARVATDDEMRRRLSDFLQEEHHFDALPASARTLAAFARSEMVEWLAYPTELGCLPAEIQQAAQVQRPLGEYFVFKFRGKDKKWLAGIVGPLVATPAPRFAREIHHTFSSFKPWESMAPAKHLDSMLATITTWENKR
jgi:hypothetical protein